MSGLQLPRHISTLPTARVQVRFLNLPFPDLFAGVGWDVYRLAVGANCEHLRRFTRAWPIVNQSVRGDVVLIAALAGIDVLMGEGELPALVSMPIEVAVAALKSGWFIENKARRLDR